MPRPKSPAPRVFVLQVRLTDDEVAILDERRGERSRTAWAREVLVGAEVSVDAEPVADYPIGPKAVAEREPVKQETVEAAINRVIDETGTRHHHIFVADGETYERGTRVRTGRCGVCGTPMPPRR